MSATSPTWPSLSGFTIELTAWIWPSAMSSAMTPRPLPREQQRAGLAVHVDLRSAAPGFARPAGSRRAGSAPPLRPPHRARASAGTFPPPSPWSTTSSASSVSSGSAHPPGRPRRSAAPALRDARARPRTSASARRRGVAPVPRAGVRCPRSCRRSRRPRRSRSRTRRGGGRPPAARARGSRGARGMRARANRPSRRAAPDRPSCRHQRLGQPLAT